MEMYASDVTPNLI